MDSQLEEAIDSMAFDPISAKRALFLAAMTGAKESPIAYFEAGVFEMAMGQFDEAAQRFELASQVGHALAEGMLKLAVKELIADLESKSAAGDLEAIVRLAEISGSGEFGLKKDFERAVSLLRPHAERGELEAQKTLGGLLAENTEFQDVREARRWLERAAEQGDQWARDYAAAV